MAIKNDCTSAFDRGSLAVSYPIVPAETHAKKQIRESAGDEKTGQRLLQLFLRKLPQAQQLVQQLMPDHLNTVHFPFSISFLLMTYMEDQIELYQSQLDERDVPLDEKWNEVRMQYVIFRSKLFVKTGSPFPSFTADLAQKLKQVDYSADFEKTVDLFLQLLRIDHVGSLHLAALFLNNKDSSRVKKDENISIQMPRASLEKAFSVLVQQLLRHYSWFIAKSEEMGGRMVSDLNLMSSFLRPPGLQEAPHQLNLDFSDSFKRCKESLSTALHLFFALELNNNQAIRLFLLFIETYLNMVRGLAEEIKQPGESLSLQLGVNLRDPAAQKAMEKFLSARLDPHLNQQERKEMLQGQVAVFSRTCEEPYHYSSLLYCYLIEPLSDLATIMRMLIDSNESFEKCQADGTKPLLAQDLPSLLPTSQTQADHEKVYQELMNEETSRKKTAGGKKSASHKGAKQIQKTAKKEAPASKAPSSQGGQASIQKEKAVSSTAATTTSLARETASIDQLGFALLGLYDKHPASKSLRQAIWHLDALKSVQEAYGKSPLFPKDYLNYANAIAQGAQKVLEQTYRFCLGEQEGAVKLHNLKRLHALFDPSSPFPDIVNTLYFANHWGRYFHIYHHQLRSETTYRIDIPPLLNLLAAAADNPQSLTGASLQKWAEEIVQKTCAQTELLLKPFLPSGNPLPAAPELSFQLPFAIPVDKWQGVLHALQTFLKAKHLSPGHPSALRLEQALSALAMLTASLEKLNGASHHRALATWTSWSLFQLQEVVENVLHTIEFFQDTEITLSHELKKLADKIKLDMGSLSADLHFLSYKPRYPVEYLIEREGARLIDDAEALKQHPELEEGFQLPSLPKLLWKLPSKEISKASILNRLNKLLDDTEAFLSGKAFPALNASAETHRLG